MAKTYRLRDLDAQLLKHTGGGSALHVETVAEADGVMFLCPKCFGENSGPVGTHVVVCWAPSVPLNVSPGPGRWQFKGTSLDDLSLVAGSSSVKLTSGCCWHGYVRRGEVVDA